MGFKLGRTDGKFWIVIDGRKTEVTIFCDLDGTVRWEPKKKKGAK